MGPRHSSESQMAEPDSEEKELRESRNRAPVEALQRGFAALTKRLTPDVEPPLVFTPGKKGEETAGPDSQ